MCSSEMCCGPMGPSQSKGGQALSTRTQRSTRSAVAGFIGHGPVAHVWLEYVDTQLSFGGAWCEAAVPRFQARVAVQGVA